jgi:hypothetical protein
MWMNHYNQLFVSINMYCPFLWPLSISQQDFTPSMPYFYAHSNCLFHTYWSSKCASKKVVRTQEMNMTSYWEIIVFPALGLVWPVIKTWAWSEETWVLGPSFLLRVFWTWFSSLKVSNLIFKMGIHTFYLWNLGQIFSLKYLAEICLGKIIQYYS